MKSIAIADLPIDTLAQSDYFSPEGELLISKGITITERHVAILRKRNIFELYCKETADTDHDELEDLLAKEFDDLGELEFEDVPLPEKVEVPSFTPVMPENLKEIKQGKDGLEQLIKTAIAANLDDKIERGPVSDKPAGTPLSSQMTQMASEERTEDYKKNIENVYLRAIDDVKRLLNTLATGRGADGMAVRRIVERFMKTFITDKNILLNIAGNKCVHGEYVYHHSLNVCLLSMNIAASAGYNQNQIFEIGMGALLHDIGMLMIPPKIKFKKGHLTQDDWFEIQKHPILGLHLLEKISRIPDSVPVIAYQVHERENGTGYPRQRNSRLIHGFSKIVACADIFESISSPRVHRPAMPPYNGMETLLKMARQGMIDGNVVKAFLLYASLFPVGSIVELSDGRIGRVIEANGVSFTKPQVSIIMDKGRKYLEKGDTQIVDLKKQPDIQIAKSHRYDYIDNLGIMRGF